MKRRKYRLDSEFCQWRRCAIYSVKKKVFCFWIKIEETHDYGKAKTLLDNLNLIG